MLDLESLKHTEGFALQFMGVAATTSMAVRVIILIFVEDVFQIIERYRRWREQIDRRDRL